MLNRGITPFMGVIVIKASREGHEASTSFGIGSVLTAV